MKRIRMAITAAAVLFLGASAWAQSTPDEKLKEGYLAGCWQEASHGSTVDGTFVLRYDLSSVSKSQIENAVADFELDVRSKTHLLVIGRPLPRYPEDNARGLIVQADFYMPLGSRDEIKKSVAQDLMKLSENPLIHGHISCLNRLPYKPSISGSN